LDEIDPDTFIKDQLKKMVQEKKKKETNIRAYSSNMDHMVRAQRELEIPHIKEYWDGKSKSDKELFEQQKEKFLLKDKEDWERDIQIKTSLKSVIHSKGQYDRILEERYNAILNTEQHKRNRSIKEYLQKRLPEYKEELRKREKKKKKEDKKKKKIKKEEQKLIKEKGKNMKNWIKIGN